MNQKREKMNLNIVGVAAYSDPHFEGNTKRTPKTCLNLTSHFSHLTSDHNGITLIALIITIIVMLILVGVTVAVAINGGLFGTAKQATTDTQYQAEREMLLSSVIGAINNDAEVDFEKLDKNLPNGFTGSNGTYTSEAGNTFYVDKNGNITDEKKPEGEASEGKWTLSENGDTVTNGDVTLNIGDYVNYKPEGSTYSSDKLKENYTGSSSNSSEDLTTDTTLKWRVLGVDTKGCLTLISDKPTTDEEVYFAEATGYNNGVYILNDICKTLYSNASLGVTARSITIEDIEAGFSDTGITERNEYSSSVQYGKTETYTRNLNYPVLYAKENGSGIDVEETNAEARIKTNGIGGSEPFYKIEDELINKTEGKESDTASNALTCTQTFYCFSSTPKNYCKNEKFYEMIFGSYYDDYYLASRYVDCDSTVAFFGLLHVGVADLNGNIMFYSDGDAGTDSCWLRPVVSLGSNISIESVSESSVSNPHKIVGLE